MVPGFHCSFLPGMPSSPTPGSPTSTCSRTSMPTSPSPHDHRLGTPNRPAIRSTRASHFVASLVRFRCGLPGCSPPCTDRTGTPQPSGTFTSRLSTDRSPSPSLDITSTVTGFLCWRDSHPLEWQLASLHGHEQTNRPRQCWVCLYSVNRPQSRRKQACPRCFQSRTCRGRLPSLLALASPQANSFPTPLEQDSSAARMAKARIAMQIRLLARNYAIWRPSRARMLTLICIEM